MELKGTLDLSMAAPSVPLRRMNRWTVTYHTDGMWMSRIEFVGHLMEFQGATKAQAEEAWFELRQRASVKHRKNMYGHAQLLVPAPAYIVIDE